jgi:hypothetical protein
MSKIRVGLIGVGNWAAYGHIPVLRLLPDDEVTAVHGPRRDHAGAIARKFGIPHVLDTADAPRSLAPFGHSCHNPAATMSGTAWIASAP